MYFCIIRSAKKEAHMADKRKNLWDIEEKAADQLKESMRKKSKS